MNKIIRVALKAQLNLNDETLNNLLLVMEATGNASVATEMILGLYEKPFINAECQETWSSRTNIKFISYNPFSNQVTFSYNSVDITTGWALQGKETYTIEDIVSEHSFASEACKELNMDRDAFDINYIRVSIPTKVYDKVKMDTIDLVYWNKNSIANA